MSLFVSVVAVFGLVWFLNRSFVTITISPAAAKLTMDNAPLSVNRKGVAKTTLSPGIHTVKVEAENFLSVSHDVDFKRGRKNNLNFTLEAKPEIFNIESGASLLSTGKNNNEIIYLDPSGTTLVRATFSFSDEQKIVVTKDPITSNRLSGINQIIWSPSKDLALFKKDDGVYLFDFQKYDFVNQTENLWGRDIGDIAWAPDNSKIAYFNNPNGEKSLIFANIDNTAPTRVANLADYGIDNPYLAWSPDSQYLIVIPRNQEYATNKIYLYDAYAGTLKTVSDIGNQISAVFSPDSSKIIYSTYSKGTGDSDPYVISAMDKDGSNQKSLDVRTSTDNIAWISNNLILAAQYSRSGNTETFFTQDFTADTALKTVQSTEAKIVNRILLAIDNKVALYENADGISGFKLQ